MSQYKSQIQNLFLSQVRKRRQKIEVVLETGKSLRGRLKAYDQFSVTLVYKDQVEVVYKSSIIYITVLPNLPEKKPFSRHSSVYSRYDSDEDRRYSRDTRGYRPYNRQTPPGYGDEDNVSTLKKDYYNLPDSDKD